MRPEVGCMSLSCLDAGQRTEKATARVERNCMIMRKRRRRHQAGTTRSSAALAILLLVFGWIEIEVLRSKVDVEVYQERRTSLAPSFVSLFGVRPTEALYLAGRFQRRTPATTIASRRRGAREDGDGTTLATNREGQAEAGKSRPILLSNSDVGDGRRWNTNGRRRSSKIATRVRLQRLEQADQDQRDQVESPLRRSGATLASSSFLARSRNEQSYLKETTSAAVLFDKVGDKGGGGRSGGDEHKLETVRKADLRTPRDPVPVLEGDGEHGDRVTGSSIVGSRWNARQSPATFLQPGGYGAEDGNFGGPNEGAVHKPKKLTTVRPEGHSSGPKKLTTVRPESRDCVGEWKSEPCKDGKTSKKFHVKTKKKGDGASCETVDNDTRENIDCGTNCEGIWRDWGDECSDDGKRTRRFHVVHKAKDGGKDCDNKDGDTQEEDCDAPAVDCKGKFQPWGACTAGFRERFYKVTQKPKNGGEDCGHADKEKDTEECGNPCKEDWGEWVPEKCTPGALIQTRAWLWKLQPTNGGKPCTTRPVESRKCGKGGKEPPRDCEGAWEPWTKCINGRMSRTYKRKHDAEPGGEDCEHEDNHRDVAQCGQPCEGAWSNWSKCTGGHQTRHYKVKKPASAAGSPAGEGRQCEIGKDPPVPIQDGHPDAPRACKAADCYGKWTPFTHCKDGKQNRHYNVITPKGPGGADCEHDDLAETKPRNCGTNCDGSWGRWSRCVAGQEGQQTQVFKVNQPALQGGKDCTVKDGDTRHLPCGEEPPPRVKGEGSAQVDFVLHHGHEHEARQQERQFGVQLSCRAKWMIVVLVVSFLGMIAVGGGLFAFGERLCDPDGVVTPGSRESIQYHYGSDEESEGDERDSETRPDSRGSKDEATSSRQARESRPAGSSSSGQKSGKRSADIAPSAVSFAPSAAASMAPPPPTEGSRSSAKKAAAKGKAARGKVAGKMPSKDQKASMARDNISSVSVRDSGRRPQESTFLNVDTESQSGHVTPAGSDIMSNTPMRKGMDSSGSGMASFGSDEARRGSRRAEIAARAKAAKAGKTAGRGRAGAAVSK